MCISGMKKESILSEEEKMQKWQKIKDNRSKKMTSKKHRSRGTSSNPGADEMYKILRSITMIH